MESFIIESIKAAGDAMLPLFQNASVLYTKETLTDVVTKADLASEQVLVERIRRAYPDHGIVSEESAAENADVDFVWCIDPLDGSRNFATGVPLFGINMALLYKGVPTHAAIHVPFLNEVYYAEKGRGAFCNGVPIHCSTMHEWKGAYGLVAPDCDPAALRFLNEFNSRSEGTGWVTAIATPAVSGAWVAAGKRDWYIGPSSRKWDYAAPALICGEAGCTVSNFAGTPWKSGDRGLVASTPALHAGLLEMIQKSFLV